MTHEALAVVAAQRERLAEKMRLPWWAWVAMTLGMAGISGQSVITRFLSADAVIPGVVWPSLALVAGTPVLVARLRGISVNTRTFDHPSARRVGLPLLAVFLVAGYLLMRAEGSAPLPWAVLAAVATTALFLGVTVVTYRAMLQDVRAGRGGAMQAAPVRPGPADADERARLPWWFWALFTVAAIALPLSVYRGGLPAGGWRFAAYFGSLVLISLLQLLVRRAKGVRPTTRLLRDYPSTRLPALTLALVAVAGTVVTFLVSTAPGGWGAISVVLTALAMLVAMRSIQGGVRRDVAGRARPA